MTLPVPTIQLFENEEVQMIEKDGEWFVTVRSIAAILQTDYRNLMRVIQRHPELFIGLKGSDVMSSPGGPQEVVTLNRDGVLTLLSTVSYKRLPPERMDRVIRLRRWMIETVGRVIDKKIKIEPPKETLSVLDEQMRIVDLLVRYGGVDRGIATSIAIANTMDITGDQTLHPYSSLLRASGADPIIRLNATQIGQRLGSIGPRDVNRLLEKMDYIRMIDGKWEVLDLGKPYADPRPFTASHKNGAKHSDIQILWKPDIVGKIQEYQNIQAHFSKGLITGYI